MVVKDEHSPENGMHYRSEKQSLLSKYDIPVHHLDFSYVETCQNGKELERILHILRSGEEGYFPDLTRAAEKKLHEIKPNSKLLRKVNRVLTKDELSKEDHDEIYEDFDKWLNVVTKHDQELESRKLQVPTNGALPDVRKTRESAPATKSTPKPKRISSTDYKSWDQYDVDTEMLKMDIEEEKLKKGAEKKVTQKPQTVKFSTFATEAEASYEANREKERGNEYYKSGEYTAALECYTSSLRCLATAPVYTNRAITHIKLKRYDDAISDCKAALKYDPNSVKAHLRLAQSFEAQKKHEAALQSAENVIRLNPNNSAAQQLAAQMRKYTGKPLAIARLKIQDAEDEDECDYEIIAIPGSSKMLPPFHKKVCNDDPDVVRREQMKIYFRPIPIYIGTIDTGSDDEECYKNHLEHRCTPRKIATDTRKKLVGQTRVNQGNNERGRNVDENRARKDDYGGGGEPYKSKQCSDIPPPQELTVPYTFLRTWCSIGKDSTYTQHAEILRKMDFEQIPEVIGYKLDDRMFSDIIHCLKQHFTVAGEVTRVYTALVNLVRIPRFKIVVMFMSYSDQNAIRHLFAFLDQHGKSLPETVKQNYFE